MKVLKDEENFIATYDKEEFDLALKEEFEKNQKNLEKNQKKLEEEKIRFAKELKNFGIPIDRIVKITELSSNQIHIL